MKKDARRELTRKEYEVIRLDGGNPKPPTPARTTDWALSQLENVVEDSIKQLALLGQRLEPVLMTPSEQQQRAVPAPADDDSAIVTRILTILGALDNLASELATLHRRTQL